MILLVLPHLTNELTNLNKNNSKIIARSEFKMFDMSKKTNISFEILRI